MMLVAAHVYNHHSNDEHLETKEELEIKNNDDIHDGTDALFDIDLRDGSNPIDLDDGNARVDGSEDTNAASSGKHTSACWEDFVSIFDENKVRTHAICKLCGKKFAARASIGTGSLNIGTCILCCLLVYLFL
jgi:hypothetical protein